jgi:hypothetical protein
MNKEINKKILGLPPHSETGIVWRRVHEGVFGELYPDFLQLPTFRAIDIWNEAQ